MAAAAKEKVLRGGTNDTPVAKVAKAKSPTTLPKRTKAEIQAIVDQLVLDKGRNVVNWGEYPQILAQLGLTQTDVTPRMIEQASTTAEAKYAEHKIHFKGRVYHYTEVPECENGDVLAWLKTLAKLLGWHPSVPYSCNEVLKQGKVTREQITPEIWQTAAKDGFDLAREWAADHNKRMRAGLTTGYVDISHQNWFKLGDHPDLRKKDCLLGSGSDNTNNTGSEFSNTNGGTTMQLNRSVAVALFSTKALGQKTDPNKWLHKIILKNVNGLGNLSAEKTGEYLDLLEEEDKTLAGVLADILNSLKNGKRVEIVDDAQEEDGGESPKKGTKMATATKKGGTKPTSEKKDKTGLDAYGSRLGTQAARIGAALAAKPKTVAVIAEETSAPKAAVYGHLKKLVAKGFASYGEKGFAKVGSGTPAKKKK